jgi:methyl-accepting chemotaxis protein
VVAQEVRNLANRSAEAAKEIKDLVQSAYDKANDGKTISDDMRQGYTQLNEKITATIDLISEVTIATKEQQKSIEQINASIHSIQSNTLESLKMANDATIIAKETNSLASTIVEEASVKKFN